MIIRGATDSMEVVLDTDSKTILITQKWHFDWRTDNENFGVTQWCYATEWTQRQKHSFMNRVEKHLMELWDSKAYAIINSSQGSAFSQTYVGIPFLIKLKIERVSCCPHWTVRVFKVPTIQEDDSYVNWSTKTIQLTSMSVVPHKYHYPIENHKPIKINFITVAHEFGHTVGDDPDFINTNEDEYYTNHPLAKDIFSIMNLGTQLRHRHFAYVRDLLQTMIPNVYFSIRMS